MKVDNREKERLLYNKDLAEMNLDECKAEKNILCRALRSIEKQIRLWKKELKSAKKELKESK